MTDNGWWLREYQPDCAGKEPLSRTAEPMDTYLLHGGDAATIKAWTNAPWTAYRWVMGLRIESGRRAGEAISLHIL